MTQEEKQLLLKDLCARLPYCPKIYYYYLNKNLVEKEETRELDFSDVETLKYNNEHPQDFWCVIVFKPYLRPIHKLTKEELEELEFLTDSDYVDYCNEHYIDYRGLIEKGLALEAPEDMYN